MKLIILTCLMVSSSVFAKNPLPSRLVDIEVDSGVVKNFGTEHAVIFDEEIKVDGATWIRLHFSTAVLGQTSSIRITSLLDGAVQTHDAETLQEWRNTSAYFNGDAVKIELLSDPGNTARIRIDEISVGEVGSPPTDNSRSICGADDDRTLASDARTARIMPIGCTAWLIDDVQGCFLTAGHCVEDAQGNLDAAASVVEFDVPLSNPNGSTNHASPDNQYPIDFSSVQWDLTGIGNDWAYFGAFPNSQTRLTPFEAQGNNFILAAPPATPGGETIRITGYGTIDGTQGTPQDWSQTQTTHTGELTGVSGTSLQYTVDTTGGNSGSAVEVEGTGTAIGIHTNAGCSAGGGANNGTSLANTGLLNALANPIGICLNGPPQIRIEQVTPIAQDIPTSGTSFQVDILDRDNLPASFNSASLIYDYGNGDVTIPLSPVAAATYEATLPASACASEVTFKIDVETLSGGIVHHPFTADNSANRRFIRRVGNSFNDTFRDTFETDQGWTVDDDPSLTAGSWERGVPAGFGRRQDPPWDADSSGSAYVTGNAAGNTDVDGGATRLVSPILDASSTEAHISYWRWWGDNGNSDDTFVVQVSDNAGGNWTTVETISNGVAAEWVYQEFRVANFVNNTNQFQIRFIAQDTNNGSIIEAAIDDVILVSEPNTPPECPIFKDGFDGNSP